jgi:hypothetical protein
MLRPVEEVNLQSQLHSILLVEAAQRHCNWCAPKIINSSLKLGVIGFEASNMASNFGFAFAADSQTRQSRFRFGYQTNKHYSSIWLKIFKFDQTTTMRIKPCNGHELRIIMKGSMKLSNCAARIKISTTKPIQNAKQCLLSTKSLDSPPKSVVNVSSRT